MEKKIASQIEPAILDEISSLMESRKSGVVFCTSVAQAERLSESFPDSVAISSNTKKAEREEMLQEIKSGFVTLAFNFEVLGTGWDSPETDLCVTLRATNSYSLHSQHIGRLLRLAEGKKDGLVVDYAGNIERLGKASDLRIVKENNVWELKSGDNYLHNNLINKFPIPSRFSKPKSEEKDFWDNLK